MFKFLMAGAAASALFAAPAMAQDSYMADEEAPFSGAYVGGSFGYDVQPNDVGSRFLFDRNLDGRFGDVVTTSTGANAFSPGFCNGRARSTLSPQNAATGCGNDKDGIAYYGRVGLDHQAGNIVYGVVGEFGKSEITDSVSAFSTTPAWYTMTRSIDWEASARGRLAMPRTRRCSTAPSAPDTPASTASSRRRTAPTPLQSAAIATSSASSAAAVSSRRSGATSRSAWNICTTSIATTTRASA
ncbi:Uncharacterised protein [Sphingomonas paucimobilis]|nr:Uncharacterised protein [Sphingomonas paucimobilis]